MKRHDPGIWERVQEACRSIDVETQTGIAKICGIQQQAVSKWATQQAAPSLSNLIDLSRATGYQVQWIATGDGVKFVEDPDPSRDKIRDLLLSLDEEELDDVLRYARFRSDDK